MHTAIIIRGIYVSEYFFNDLFILKWEKLNRKIEFRENDKKKRTKEIQFHLDCTNLKVIYFFVKSFLRELKLK